MHLDIGHFAEVTKPWLSCHMTSLPCLTQVISLVGWPKLVKSFFFLFK